MDALLHHEELMTTFDQTFLQPTRGIYGPVSERQKGADQDCDFG